MLMSRISSVVLRNLSRVSRDDMSSCILVRKMGADTIHSAVVPMWIFYQFMISVVLLRIELETDLRGVRSFTITEKLPTCTFTFKTLY